MSETQIRWPRTHGFPKQISGLMLILSSSSSRLKQAVDDVTGGILSHNGGQFIAPQRGMPQATFDRVLWSVTDQDLAGVTTLAGQPVTRDYLRGSAQLESYGDGRYLVRLGRDPARPTYAVRSANTEMPEKFVLDLRGRKPAYQVAEEERRVSGDFSEMV